MKSKNYFKELLLLVFVITAFSCSKSNDDGGDGGDGGGNGGGTVTSITLNTPNSTVIAGSDVTFTVINNLGIAVTNESTLKVDGVAIPSNIYNFPSEGQYDVVAEYSGFTSNILTINALQETSITMSTSLQEKL